MVGRKFKESKPEISRCMKRRPSDTNIYCHYPLVARVVSGVWERGHYVPVV